MISFDLSSYLLIARTFFYLNFYNHDLNQLIQIFFDLATFEKYLVFLGVTIFPS